MTSWPSMGNCLGRQPEPLQRRGTRGWAVDATIVGPGGGSNSSLQVSNTERVAERPSLPTARVVTAIGHTAERTIVGQVGNIAAIAPATDGK